MKLNPINVLFLDFDGVVNTRSRKKDDVHVYQLDKKHFDVYNKALCKNIELLIKQFDFKIVISSSWRATFDIISIRDIINNQMGIDCEVIDYTTRKTLDVTYKERFEDNPTTISRDRGLQITDWLLEKKYKVNNYFVLDDSLDAEYGHSNNYYRVNNTKGFDKETLDDVTNIISKLFNTEH